MKKYLLAVLCALQATSGLGQTPAPVLDGTTDARFHQLEAELEQLRAAQSRLEQMGSLQLAPPQTGMAQGSTAQGSVLQGSTADHYSLPMSSDIHHGATATTPEGRSTRAPAPAAPTYPNFKVTGFIHLDDAHFSQDTNSINTVGDVNDGLGFRRARVAATGNLSQRASYMMEFDFAQAQARFVDVWGQMSDTPFGNIRIGRFRQPFGMSELTSIRELPFLERPSTFVLAPFRQTGIMFFDTAFDQRATWALSGFRTLSDNFGNVYGEQGGYGMAARATGLVIDNGDTGILHVGADYSYLDPARDVAQYVYQNEVFVGQQPNLGPTGLSVFPIESVPPFVNSGLFAVNQINLYNFEAAASLGRALVQSEVRWARVNTPSGTAVIPAAYLDARYMLTGEVIPYSRANGAFARPTPLCPLDVCKGQWGAWELASRVSYIDMNELSALPSVPGPGRMMTNYTTGLNWYMIANAKLQFDYIYTDLNDRALGDSNTHTLATRFQFDF